MSSKTQHGQYLIDFLSDSANQNKFTNKELAQIATDKCGYFISGDTVRKILRRVNMERLVLPPNVIIKKESSSTGEVAMKPSDKELAAFQAHCEANGLPFSQWRGFWHKDGVYSAFFTNQKGIEEEKDDWNKIIEDMKKHAPKYQKRDTKVVGEHMLVLPLADIHVGKWAALLETGDSYNMEVTLKRAREGTADLVNKAKMFGIKQFVVCLGNDILHTDNGKTTTNGTPQDTHGTWFESFRMARQLYITMIEELVPHADVLLVHIPCNHAWRSAYALSEVVAAHFHKHPNVTSMVTERHRKYVVYGQNLIMFTHGDGAKEKDLHWHMATESKEAWSKTRFRYAYLGHLHHSIRKVKGHQDVRTEKDLIGVTEIVTGHYAHPDEDITIQYVRSQSSSDSWHNKSGYTSMPATEAFLHHPEHGNVARFTHYF